MIVHCRHIDHVRFAAIVDRFGDHVGLDVTTQVHGLPVAGDVRYVRFHFDALRKRQAEKYNFRNVKTNGSDLGLEP